MLRTIQVAFWQSLVSIGPTVFEKNIKMTKCYNFTNNRWKVVNASIRRIIKRWSYGV